MIKLTQEQKSQYFHRSYTAVDGLWFIKAEERYGFDTAMELDDAVWQVMPKIQARWLKSVAGAGEGIGPLLECFTTKLNLDGHVFSVNRDEVIKEYQIIVRQCPWLQLMKKSDREHLAGKLGERICVTECLTWASEFGKNIQFSIEGMLCGGDSQCILSFREQRI